MKPEQFIREFGVDEAREVVNGAPEGATDYELNVDGDFYFKYENFNWLCFGDDQLIKTYMDEYETQHLIPLSCLNRLVASLDLIKHMGGISEVKRKFRDNGSCHGERMKALIKDHESIYGGEDE